MNNTYKFSEDDLIQVLLFTKEYHLEISKGRRGRTNSGRRSFGGELDEFIPGKLCEIGVCKIIEKYSKNTLKLFPDTEIYTDKEVGLKADPDIIEVERISEEKRKTKLHVEVKRYIDSDVWLGIRSDQLSSAQKIHGLDINKKMYMVHASIEFEDDKNIKERDITGSILKKFVVTKKFNLNEFSDFESLVCKIHFIYKIDDLLNLGNKFPAQEIIPADVFVEAAEAHKANGETRKGYVFLCDITSSNHNIAMRIKKTNTIPFFGNWNLNGSIELFDVTPRVMKNKKHTADAKAISDQVIYCKEDTVLFNKYFGRISLQKGKTYQFYFVNKLGSDFKSIDDWWFNKRYLSELVNLKNIKPIEEQIEEIIQAI